MDRARAVFQRIGQPGVIRVPPADDRCPRPGRGCIIRHAEMQAFVPFRRAGNFRDILHSKRGFDDMFETDALLITLGILDLGHQHIDGIDIRRSADFRDHDQIQPFSGLFDHVHHVAIHVVRVQPVDPHRHGFLAPVDLVQRLDDVLAGLRLVVRGDRVLEVEEDHIRIRLCSLFKHLDRGSRNGEFRAVQTGGGLFDGVEAHGANPSRLGCIDGQQRRTIRMGSVKQ